jgi:hypothetical protein
MSDRKPSVSGKRKGSRFAKGYLEKLSSGLVKKWLSRYFELSGHYLKYYEKKETQSDATLKGVVNLKDVSEVHAEGAQIVIARSDGSTIKLKGPSEEVAGLWSKEIEQVLCSDGSQQVGEHQAQTETKAKAEIDRANADEKDLQQLAQSSQKSVQQLPSVDDLKKWCMVMGCINAIDETVCGSGYCVEHEHHPVGKATFEVVRQVLIDIRESTGHVEWTSKKTDWDKLETYTTIEELGQCGGVTMRDGKLVKIDLESCNLTGTLPPSLAKLDTLEELYIWRNDLRGLLPAHIGSVSCLPSLKDLQVEGNKQLGGVIDVCFLANSEDCDASGCHRSMQFPFLSGASLSSFNIQGIFAKAPKAVVGEERAQGKVTFLYPKGSPKNTGTEEEQDQMDRQYRQYTDHLQELWREQGAEGSYEEWLTEHISKWCCWAETWLSELRQLRKGYLFVFVTPEKDAKHGGEYDDNYEPIYEEWINKLSFETKFKSKMYTEGKVDDREWSSSKGSFMSGRAWCREQCFDPSRGFADEGWGFEEGEEASGIMDWERRHLASVSKKHGLQTVFISTGKKYDGRENMVQVTRPSWYPYAGLEAPLGTFAWNEFTPSAQKAANKKPLQAGHFFLGPLYRSPPGREFHRGSNGVYRAALARQVEGRIRPPNLGF